MALFGGASAQKRLYHGGLPEILLAERKSPSFFREWMDSFFARDVQRLFAFRNAERFNDLLEYVMRQSGGLMDVSRADGARGISRSTVDSYLRALETTNAVTLVRPFHGRGQKEIVKTPKAYGFDTGCMSFCRGWDPLRPDDYGPLWEHVVLEINQCRMTKCRASGPAFSHWPYRISKFTSTRQFSPAPASSREPTAWMISAVHDMACRASGSLYASDGSPPGRPLG